MTKRFFLLLAAGLIVYSLGFNPDSEKTSLLENYPNDWFFRQRAFPQEDINYEVYQTALLQAQSLKRHAFAIERAWTFAGPTNIGGRITDVEMSSAGFDTIYAGAASGGLFKSVDRGQSWIAIFDQEASLSIGDIALDPSNANVVYVGTGEVNAGGGSLTYGGFGLYKSLDAGQSWIHLGLEETRFIARVAIDPRNPQRSFVAAMGKLFGKNDERGLYRSLDGGATWENVLFISDSTGCIDVAVHPASPDTIYAAMWERIRRPDRRSYGGLTSGIYRSSDGGETWTRLTNGLPNAPDMLGRIGLALSPSRPNILYAIYADRIGYFAGVYKSANAGEDWQRTNDDALNSFYASYGWWFGNIRVAPDDPQTVYALGLLLYKSTDGGQSWFYSSGDMHVDQHGLYVHPQNPGFLVAGNDGGVYLSEDGGANWSKSPELPITQFYTCEIDYQFPERFYGGTQDNGTNRTLTGARDDWEEIFGGDGFYVLVDPTDNRFVYAESQWGNFFRSTDGGLSFDFAMNGVNPGDRKNWNTPVVFNPSNPRTLMLGTQRVYKSADRASSWTAISPELSPEPTGNLIYGTVTTIAVAPSDSNVIYAGTDDGNVWRTLEGGESWLAISETLPKRWITRVAADSRQAEIAYVTLSGFRWEEYLPHLFRTTDAGATWSDISGNLPEAPLNDVIIDPERDSTLYVAGDVGVFVTHDLGEEWSSLGAGLPNVPIMDLTFHSPTRTLVAATYGRSMYRIEVGPSTGIQLAPSSHTPKDFELSQNYPNPFNAGTVIPFSLRERASVVLEVFDISGRRVRTLANAIYPSGKHELFWDGKNDEGGEAASGAYICRLRTTGECCLKACAW